MTDSQSNDRDARGRFGPGNGAAFGRGVARHRAQLARAMREIVDSDTVRKLADELLAIAHDRELEPTARIAAARLLLEHSVGRPREADAEAAVPSLPPLRDSSAVLEAVSRVFESVSEGGIDVADAGRLVDAITKAAAATAWSSLETRVATIERERARR